MLFGKAGGMGTVDATARRVVNLTNLSSADGFVIQGDEGGQPHFGDGDKAGSSVSSAGDVNKDGYDDVIVGAPGGGEAYVLYGKAGGVGTVDATGRRVVDLTDLSPADGFVIQGGAGSAGSSVSSAGDVNGDGYDDLIVGAPQDYVVPHAGEAYIVYGTVEGIGTVDATGRRVVDLADLSPTDGFVIQGDASDRAGSSVSSAGDVNGDGYDDVIVGAPEGDDGGDRRRRGLCAVRQGRGRWDGGRHGSPGGGPDGSVAGGRLRDSRRCVR